MSNTSMQIIRKSRFLIFNLSHRGLSTFAGVNSKGPGNVADIVFNPATGEEYAKTPNSTTAEINEAVNAAQSAFAKWNMLPPAKRVRYILNLYDKIKHDSDNLASIISCENGKTINDARGDLTRGLEALQQAIAAPEILLGRHLVNAATDVDITSYKVPLGVCVGIAPFNFPAMIPLWMFPMAIALGNTFILKPSSRTPLTSMRLITLAQEAGIPEGVLNVVHGLHQPVTDLVSNPHVKAISFVGGNNAGRAIYELAGKYGKRAQCNMGAKNAAIVLPDADLSSAVAAISGAAFGAAGQRCMAISILIVVGSANQCIGELIEVAQSYKVGKGSDPSTDVGPMITAGAKERALGIIKESVDAGDVDFLVDGTNISISSCPNGHFIGPTILKCRRSSYTAVYKNEMFAPVLTIVEVPDFDSAIKLVNGSRFVSSFRIRVIAPQGNGTALFTSSGYAARRFELEAEIGQIGINLPIPVAVPPFGFTGWKDSMAGDLNMCGRNGGEFYLKTKNIMRRWSHTSEVSGKGVFPH